MIVKEVCINMSNDFKFKEPVYLKIDFLNGAKFNPLFDTADLLPSQALGGRLMNAFYTGVGLKKVSHSDALKHIVDSVRGNETDSIVPIVIHFDEHGEFIAARNEFLENNYGKKYFLNMLMELGSAATSNSDNLGSLHKAGSFFIVPITTGTSHSDANFDSINTYSLQLVSLPVLDSRKTEDLAVACLQQFSPNVEIAAVLSDNLFQIALGDTGGLPGLIFYACLPGNHSYLQNLHTRVGNYVKSQWNARWRELVTVFLARPDLSQIGNKISEDYTVQTALDSGTVYLDGTELRLAPALLAKFNAENHKLFNPLLVKVPSEAEEWTWQDFERAHVLYLAATIGATIAKQNMFEKITLGTILRSVQPKENTVLLRTLKLPAFFDSYMFQKQESQCIPNANAKKKKAHSVNLQDFSRVFLVADGTPVIDAFVNLRLKAGTAGRPRSTTLFIQYKHSGLDSRDSAVNVSTMNQSVTLLAGRLKKHGWPKKQDWILLWVTNREVERDVEPNEKLLWVDKASLAKHAPLLGRRGHAPLESLREHD